MASKGPRLEPNWPQDPHLVAKLAPRSPSENQVDQKKQHDEPGFDFEAPEPIAKIGTSIRHVGSRNDEVFDVDAHRDDDKCKLW